MTEIETAIDELYGLPLGEFVAARNRLAAELRKEDGEAADRVKALQKPTVAAWTANQVIRRNELEARRLLNAADQLRKSQQQAVRSGGASDEFASARREEHEVLRRLLRAAAESPEAPTDQTLSRVEALLRAAAHDDTGREDLRRGRLTADVEPQGFEAFAGIAPKPVPRRRAPTAADRRRAEAARAKASELREEAASAEAAAAEARRALELAERDARRARINADRAEEAAEKASARLQE